MKAKRSFLEFLQLLGPGLLFAGAAVGVSHLVQSTKAGATYGFSLLVAVLLANLFKYPFFEFGTRYAAATGETLIEGYKKQGYWALGIFIIMTLGTVFTIQAAVTVVTAGLAMNLFGGGFGIGALGWSAIILAICASILLIGRYSILDNFIKFIVLLLTVTTILALISVLFWGEHPMAYTDPRGGAPPINPFEWNKAGILFLIALMGWMPAPLDLSIWSSIWTLEKKKLQKNSNLETALLDFNVGYIGTVILAVCFLSLGALVMYRTGEVFSPKGHVFAGQLISMYTNSLGTWAMPIIAVAAFTTMFSTTLTCLDAIPRVLSRTVIVLFPQYDLEDSRKLYWFWSLFLIAGSLIILGLLNAQMGTMVNIATILSFLTAPFLAVINYKLVSGNQLEEDARPPKWLIVLSWLGMAFLIGFSILFLLYWFK